MQRAILHMDLDSFFVSVERLLDSRLRGKPILLGGTSDRGVVACSYEACAYGVRSGMAMKMAKQRCPEGIVIRGNSMTYTKYSRIITEILKEEVPLLEKASIDEFYADLSGMDQFSDVMPMPLNYAVKSSMKPVFLSPLDFPKTKPYPK